MIIKYEVKECSKFPEGRSKLIDRFDTLEQAIDKAKRMAKKNLNTDFFVQETLYASIQNLEKNFSFNQYIRWASYFNSLD